MKWFGTPMTADLVVATVPVPVGEPCALCRQLIASGDRGLMIPHLGQDDVEWHDQPWHVSCFQSMLC